MVAEVNDQTEASSLEIPPAEDVSSEQEDLGRVLVQEEEVSTLNG